MPDTAQQTIYLSDYRPPAYLIDDVHLTFVLSETATRVRSKVRFRPNRQAPGRFSLDGEHLKLISAAIDGKPVAPVITDTGLTCAVPDVPFLWEAEVEIDPAANTVLEGLYLSNGMFATQCEAQGFRRITYYPDRPDVMAPFTVRVESDLPVLLSNGNPGARGDGWAEWHDPWPKPAYLFALVAGDLAAHSGSFRTISGREVALNVWVRPGPDQAKCAWAMDSLKRAMAWDESVYGREYDLDIFNIVAVDDFNSGAMENKGLNIFNSSAVLASPEAATDADFERIEGIVAHEYFHNWTGNRITCRDWFQLSLKEGLTVFRDQQFTGDMRSAPVKRIDDVLTLRAHQFREDNGPLAHAVRPESFVEISNFYTATVYEKGAEIIGMLKRLVGVEGYRSALDLYFDRHDGQAATIEDWLRVFEDSTGRDLGQFKRWYAQAGTPRLSVSDDFTDGTYTLTLTQETPPTPGQDDKSPLHMPIAVGLLGPNGDEVLATTILELTEASQTFTFDGLSARPVPSINRGFSAPVILNRVTDDAERAFLLTHDTDPFNRWEAGRTLAKNALVSMITQDRPPSRAFLDGLAVLASDTGQDPAFRAVALSLPGQDDIAQTLFEGGITPDPTTIWQAREALAQAVAERLADDLPGLMAATEVREAYKPDADQSGRRDLLLAAAGYLSRLDGGAAAARMFGDASNMTLQLGALLTLLRVEKGKPELAQFHDSWKGDRLVMHKWFSAQVISAHPDRTAEVARGLTEHPDFDWQNPNRFRSVIGALGGNPAGFHDPSGASYDLVADWLIRLDPINPRVTARMCTLFETWLRYDPGRQAMMRTAIKRIADAPNISRDTGEMLARLLG